MDKQKFLNFIADRLVNKYGENPNVDFILQIRKMAEEKPSEKITFPYIKHCALAVWLSDYLYECFPDPPSRELLFEKIFTRIQAWPSGDFSETIKEHQAIDKAIEIERYNEHATGKLQD